MTLNVYIASITANTEVRKQVQKVLMVLDGLGVPFKAIDITLRGNEQQRDFMRENAVNERCDGVPLPPQFFVDEEYLGNYMDFEEAVEDNQLPEFLRLIPTSDKSKDADGESNENEDEEDDEEDEDEEGEEGTSEGDEDTGEEEGYDEEDEGEGKDEQEDAEGQTDEQEDEETQAVQSKHSNLSSSSKNDVGDYLEDSKKLGEISRDRENEKDKEETKEKAEEEDEADGEGDEGEGDDEEVELEDEDFEDEGELE